MFWLLKRIKMRVAVKGADWMHFDIQSFRGGIIFGKEKMREEKRKEKRLSANTWVGCGFLRRC